MKKSEIKPGVSYSNGKGKIRKVLDFGPQYKLYNSQFCTENLQYEIVNDGTKKNRTKGEKHNMTLVAFASWAKEVCG